MEFIGGAWTVAHRALGPDLYGGTSGVALFLARLHVATKQRLYRVVAEAAARQALSQVDKLPASVRIGFYSGAVGIAFALVNLGEMFGEQGWIDKGLHIARQLAQGDLGEQGLDVTSGSAGAIPALLRLHSSYKQDFLMDLALRHGRRLMDTARKADQGWSWDTLHRPDQPGLTGFSHGTAGIAWALLELHHATGENTFRAAAEQAIRYERHWFNAEQGNWADLRSLFDPTLGDGKTLTYMLAWCHGAPGIGLARIRALEITGDGSYREEAEIAVRTTAESLKQSLQTGQGNFSLCHGLAGNAELLLFAAEALAEPQYKALAEEIGQLGISLYEADRAPWPCGVLGGDETPSLLLGLAGIGWFYLRLYDQTTPSVLILKTAADIHSFQARIALIGD